MESSSISNSRIRSGHGALNPFPARPFLSRSPACPGAQIRPMRRLILRSFLSPGDILMLTAAVRDLHRCHPGEFLTDIRTSCPPLWENNPNITELREGDSG